MRTLVVFVCTLATVMGGIIHHTEGEGHGSATSYQNIHFEHFYPVPTYAKNEFKHLLEHPLPIGKSSSKVEVHHGGKHDYGYAIVKDETDVHGGGSTEGSLEHFQGQLGGQEHLASTHSYEVYDHNQDQLQQNIHYVPQYQQQHEIVQTAHIQVADEGYQGSEKLAGDAAYHTATLGHYQSAGEIHDQGY